MNITTINQLVSINILLNRDEALAALKDPSDLLIQLREALGDSIEPIPIRGLMGHGRHKRAVPKGKAKRAAAKARASAVMICLKCGEEFKARGLGVHMARKHKNDAPAAAA